MDKLKKDALLYVILLLMSLLFYFIFIPQQIVLRGSWSGDIVFTSRTFPYILFMVMGFTSVIGLIHTVFKIKSCTDRNTGIKTDYMVAFKNIITPIYFFILICLYAFLFSKTGYIIATVIMIPSYLFSLKCKKWQYYLSTYCVAAVIYVVFKCLLNIPL